MASRDLTTMRGYTEMPEADISSEQAQFAAAEFGKNIIKAGQETKIAESISSAQLDIGAAMNQLAIDYQADPTAGQEAFKKTRSKIIDQYGKGISPFFKQDFNKQSAALIARSDLAAQQWAIKQSGQNAKLHLQTTMQNYLNQAVLDGERYASDPSAELDSFANYGAAHVQLDEYGKKTLGEVDTKMLTDEFGQDYMKMFVTGIASKNPARAVEMLKSDKVRSVFTDQAQYVKMRESFENKAEHEAKIAGKRQVLGGLRKENEFLRQGGKGNYATIEQSGITGAAKEYFDKLNGFSKGSGKRGGFTAEDKIGFKTALFEAVQDMAESDNVDEKSLRYVQDKIYMAMNKGAISEKEGLSYLNQIIDPVIEQKEKHLSQYETGKWNPLADNLGFDGIKDYYEKNVKVSGAASGANSALAAQAQNKANKANLYSYYLGALEAQATNAGMTIGDINKAPKAVRQKIYGAAQAEAQRLFTLDKTPTLRTLPDVPNFVLSGDKMVQGAAGARNLQPTAAAKDTFKLFKHKKTGDVYRVYPNGKIEPAK